MEPVRLDLLPDLALVPEKFSGTPLFAIPNLISRLSKIDDYDKKILRQFILVKKDFDVLRMILKNYPEKVMSTFNPQEMAMLYFSMSYSCEDLEYKFTENGNLPAFIVKRLKNSARESIFSSVSWNQVVDLYQATKKFQLGDNLKVSWDCCEGKKGYSYFNQEFLDGSAAFLIKHQDKHVMTIGYNCFIEEDKKIARIVQIQLKQAKKNRFLYQFPEGYVPHIVKSFTKAFDGFEIQMVNGTAACKAVLDSYQKGIDAFKSFEKANWRDAESSVEKITELAGKMSEFKDQQPRVRRIYNQPIPGYQSRRKKGFRILTPLSPTKTSPARPLARAGG
jgi:hypothetical protein